LTITGHARGSFAAAQDWQMRSIVIVIALIAALGAAADFYWYGGLYTRMVIRSLGWVLLSRQ